MKAVALLEYGGPEKLKFEDNVAEPPRMQTKSMPTFSNS
jgi:hypothetical protein